LLIDRSHRGWALASLALTVAGGASYVLYVWSRPYGASGGSWPGLGYGIVGTAFMVAAALLAARKKVRTLRLGAAQTWMRAHIWLALLAVPFILFHAGFRLGGPLTTWLMALFAVVTVSGIFGVVVQQLLPSRMAVQVPRETTLGQIEHVREGLAADAYEIVASRVGELPEAVQERARIAEEQRIQAARPGYWKKVAREAAAEEPAPEADRLRRIYLAEVRPYLLGLSGGASTSRDALPDLRAHELDAPEEWRDVLPRLADLCEEARQLEVQRRMHRVLHDWLFVHAPLSFALLVLAAFHIYFALSYKLGD
jgi:hypothetical protein